MDHSKKAEELFLSGYNCAQAVFCAFCDLTGLEVELAARLSSSFGGGLARLREVCGAVSGMAMTLGYLYGYGDPGATDEKKEHYARVRGLVEKFSAECGHYICRELLGEGGKDSSPVPEKRTEAYYKKRPCAKLCAVAAQLIDDYISEVGL
ncbi:MAG: C_GCAxxG_C_C family protein [Ruminococcaceae bacterium]|nr:C_GCAxxG_C_C family protein [Oscillospiraceae bacterium]